MGEVFGVMFKRGPKGGMGNVLKKIQMRYESRGLLKSESGEKKAIKHIIQDLRNHSIEGAAKDMDDSSEKARKAEEEGYKLVMNDMIVLKVLIQNIEQIIDINKMMIKRLEKIIGEQKRAKVVNLKVVKSLKEKRDKLEKDNGGFNRDLEYVRDRLNDGRALIEELVGAAEQGKLAMRLGTKEKVFIDNRLYNYWRMRSEIRGANIIKELREVRTDVAGAFKKFKADKLTPKNFEKLLAEEKKLVKHAKDSASKFFKLLDNSCIIMHIIIKLIRNLVNKEYDAWKNHEIPEAIWDKEKDTKKDIMKEFENYLRAEHKAVLEEWQMAKAA